MIDPYRMGLDAALSGLKGVAEATRLRILLLLCLGDLTVTDLTTILSQSQPRISRHLRLLNEAGLIDRHPEGAWVYYRPADEGPAKRLIYGLTEYVDPDDPVLLRDRERLARVKRANAERAGQYFAANAADWGKVRALHVPEEAVEAAMLELVGDRRVHTFLDLGTGTGRMLELFHGIYDQGIGVDTSHPMLSVARASLDRASLDGTQVRHGDIFNLTMARDSFDLVTLHQVLHYLDDPGGAIAEAARVMRAGARMLIVDFLPHHLEFLRTDHAHQRLGFSNAQMADWLKSAGLEPVATRNLSDASGSQSELTIGMWLASDPRIVVADAAEAIESVG